jgi:hypothetical protein
MDAHAEWLEIWRQWAIVIGLAVICVLFFVASKWVLRCIASLHPDLRGFLALALWFALFVLGLFALEDRHYVAVRIYILFGAIGIMSVARWAARLLWPEEWNLVENKD